MGRMARAGAKGAPNKQVCTGSHWTHGTQTDKLADMTVNTKTHEQVMVEPYLNE